MADRIGGAHLARHATDPPVGGGGGGRRQRARGARWISGCPSCQGNLVDVCSVAGFQPDITYETDDYIALQGLAAAGLGVALLPDLMLMATRHDADLVLKPLLQKRFRRVSVVTTRALASVPGVTETMQAIVGVGQGLLLPEKVLLPESVAEPA
ncbi:hypothetical protein Rai3103_06005 [Raineyella fluvialis]|uniref:LysR substrate-binding domain-containing protein n=1 Tax=Raineyella fluvialis TaxID=2662261 RepID=A0A5Q2F8R6_9ACTN|nr:hypothetical protein Rai3103_06005 [Raineyella fluvialis]